MLAVLDTTVLIDALRGRPVVERLRSLQRSGDTPATSVVNVEEVVRGLRPAEHAGADRLFAGLVVLPVDEAAARLSGIWRREHASRGITLGQADCLVAATAHTQQARMCTGNPKDFPMISVEHWPVGQ